MRRKSRLHYTDEMRTYIWARYKAGDSIWSIARKLNELPRKTLDYETPAGRFNECVAATD